MRYRWKMLILFLAIAMVPIMAIRTIGTRAVRQLGDELISRSRQNRINALQNQIQILVNSYASVLWANREQVETALMLQAREVERCLAKQTTPFAPVYFAEDYNSGQKLPPDTMPSSFHFRSRPGEQLELLKISLYQQVFKLTHGTNRKDVEKDIFRLAAMTPTYREIYDRLSGLIYWHYTSLDNGLHSAYPGHNGIPWRFDPREQLWYRSALQTNESWSDPYIDPETRQVVVAAAQPVKRPNGTVAGVTALIVPVGSMLNRRLLYKNIPPETGSFLIYLKQRKETGQTGARIFARDEHINIQHRSWRSQMGSEWLESSDKNTFGAMLKDLASGISRFRRMPYKGKDSLWIYGAVHSRAFLVLITPYDEIIKPAEQIKKYVEERIDNLLKYTRYGIYGTILLVTLLAFSFSRSVTRPIQALAEGARQLSRGQFDWRVNIRSRDEFGNMGEIFNNVGPRLKELYHMRHSLALAMEVQQNLLPENAPKINGLDIAGKSIYCDETGGDYFDFLNKDTAGNISIVVGDVSDHGIPSALLMTTARAFLRQRASLQGDIKNIVCDVNTLLAKDVQGSGRFMTLFYAQIDSREKHIRWVRAGHDPALFYDPATDLFSELAGKGLPLGIFEDSAYEESRRELASGQIIVIGTDGIWETVNAAGEMFGKDALKKIVRSKAGKSSKKIIAAIVEAAGNFRGKMEQNDDVTLVVVKVL